ncbi:hypothetical protein LCGC14_0918950 [marine sediment metagenome]|uniref:SpoVT-AbrB domain-containing protein n=1 Tax=marine sediment metagenome TaxID=412755 RepID=A0A0F9NW55_9ZZZZ
MITYSLDLHALYLKLNREFYFFGEMQDILVLHYIIRDVPYEDIIVRIKIVFPKKFKYSEDLFINMTIDDNSRVGKKGEILPKKALRELSGIKPGDNILIVAQPGQLIIKKIFSVEELLEMPIISQGTAESIEREIEEEVKIQEKLTNDEH